MTQEPRTLLRILKDTDGNLENTLCIPVGNPVICYLRPVSTGAGRQNKNDVECLTEWRNQNPTAFLTEFKATPESTSKWLSDIVHNKDNKILFMLDDLQRRTFGYMGLDYIHWDRDQGEADAIVKGREIEKGVMKQCILTMFKWAKYQLGLKTIEVRVLSDNPALEFYYKVGFKEFQRIPLARKEHAGKIAWEEDKSLQASERYLVYLRLNDGLV